MSGPSAPQASLISDTQETMPMPIASTSPSRSYTALAPLLATLTAAVHAAATTDLLAPSPTTAATEQLAKAVRQALAPTPDTLRLAVHLVAARALSDALAHLHRIVAAPPSPSP